jgi:uncharacterized repeat protein (TIGR01451 family)
VPSGGTAYWKITATNTGQVALSGVTINDALVPACTTAAGSFSLPVGGSMTVYCSSANVTGSFTNVATAIYPLNGGPPGGGSVTSAGGMASITVVAPSPPAPIGPVGPAVTG